VSATERLAGSGPARDWAALARALEGLAVESGAALVRAAEERGIRLHADRLVRELEERRGALLRPVEESEPRIDALRKCAEEEPEAEVLYRQAAQRFVALANGFLERLAASGEATLRGLPRSVGPELGFRTRSGLTYTELHPLAVRSPLGWAREVFGSRKSALRSVDIRVCGYLERLLATNAARVKNELKDRVLESRRRLEAEIRGHLREVYASAERALHGAREREGAGGAAVRAELERLEALRRRVEALREEPGGGTRERPSRRDGNS
jgi:hypothetical protein